MVERPFLVLVLGRGRVPHVVCTSTLFARGSGTDSLNAPPLPPAECLALICAQRVVEVVISRARWLLGLSVDIHFIMVMFM